MEKTAKATTKENQEKLIKKLKVDCMREENFAFCRLNCKTVNVLVWVGSNCKLQIAFN